MSVRDFWPSHDLSEPIAKPSDPMRGAEVYTRIDPALHEQLDRIEGMLKRLLGEEDL